MTIDSEGIVECVENQEGLLKAMSEALFRTSIKSADQLKAWLDASGRRWIIFDSLELVDALQFGNGLAVFMQMIAAYRDHRRTIPTGDVKGELNPVTGDTVNVAVMKDEVLTVSEMDRLIRYLIGQITEQDPGWSLNSPGR